MKDFAKYSQNFIGKTITITDSCNLNFKNLSGKIIDETKNTFKIKTSEVPDDVKIILKNQIVFFIGTNKKDLIYGNQIIKRSEDRLKLKVKK